MKDRKHDGLAFPKPAPKEREVKRLVRKSRLRKRGERGLTYDEADSICGDFARIRDGGECQAHAELEGGTPPPATHVHHIARKLTDQGVDVRFRSGWLISLCTECHQQEHGQRGEVDRLKILGVQVAPNRVTWHMVRGDKSAIVTKYDVEILKASQIQEAS